MSIYKISLKPREKYEFIKLAICLGLRQKELLAQLLPEFEGDFYFVKSGGDLKPSQALKEAILKEQTQGHLKLFKLFYKSFKAKNRHKRKKSK